MKQNSFIPEWFYTPKQDTFEIEQNELQNVENEENWLSKFFRGEWGFLGKEEEVQEVQEEQPIIEETEDLQTEEKAIKNPHLEILKAITEYNQSSYSVIETKDGVKNILGEKDEGIVLNRGDKNIFVAISDSCDNPELQMVYYDGGNNTGAKLTADEEGKCKGRLYGTGGCDLKSAIGMAKLALELNQEKTKGNNFDSETAVNILNSIK